MTQRQSPAKGKTFVLRLKVPQPLVDTWEEFRFCRFLRAGFMAPDNQSKTRYSTYKVLKNPGISDERLFGFLKAELGMAHFPTLMGEFDGHITLKMFKAAELEGLVVLERRVEGARMDPVGGNFHGGNFE